MALGLGFKGFRVWEFGSLGFRQLGLSLRFGGLEGLGLR